jgi:hypothetical protein
MMFTQTVQLCHNKRIFLEALRVSFFLTQVDSRTWLKYKAVKPVVFKLGPTYDFDHNLVHFRSVHVLMRPHTVTTPCA